MVIYCKKSTSFLHFPRPLQITTKRAYYPSGVQFRNYIEPEITRRPLRGQEGYPPKRGAGNARSLGGVCASPNRPWRMGVSPPRTCAKHPEDHLVSRVAFKKFLDRRAFLKDIFRQLIEVSAPARRQCPFKDMTVSSTPMFHRNPSTHGLSRPLTASSRRSLQF